jgi:hypothetical protein
MPIQSSQQTHFKHATGVPTPAQSADYTYDMLISLGKFATQHNQTQLARLIEAAAVEARANAGRGSDQP